MPTTTATPQPQIMMVAPPANNPSTPNVTSITHKINVKADAKPFICFDCCLLGGILRSVCPCVAPCLPKHVCCCC